MFVVRFTDWTQLWHDYKWKDNHWSVFQLISVVQATVWFGFINMSVSLWTSCSSWRVKSESEVSCFFDETSRNKVFLRWEVQKQKWKLTSRLHVCGFIAASQREEQRQISHVCLHVGLSPRMHFGIMVLYHPPACDRGFYDNLEKLLKTISHKSEVFISILIGRIKAREERLKC